MDLTRLDYYDGKGIRGKKDSLFREIMLKNILDNRTTIPGNDKDIEGMLNSMADDYAYEKAQRDIEARKNDGIYRHKSSIPQLDKKPARVSSESDRDRRLGKILDTGNVYTEEMSIPQRHGLDMSDDALRYVSNMVDRLF